MILALTVVHVAVAAAWFGHKLLVPGDIRRCAGAGPDEAAGLVGRLRRAERLGQLTGAGTLLSGGALVWAIGVDNVRAGIWVGAALVMGAIVLGALVARPTSKRLVAAVEAGDRVAASIAGARIGRVLGLESLLWVAALSAMFW